MKLSKEAREARREYEREWRRKNPDKVAAKAARYWEKKAREAAEAKDGNKGKAGS